MFRGCKPRIALLKLFISGSRRELRRRKERLRNPINISVRTGDFFKVHQ